jgi:hypothetical protein
MCGIQLSGVKLIIFSLSVNGKGKIKNSFLILHMRDQNLKKKLLTPGTSKRLIKYG